MRRMPVTLALVAGVSLGAMASPEAPRGTPPHRAIDRRTRSVESPTGRPCGSG
jgi:hypothetical protein